MFIALTPNTIETNIIVGLSIVHKLSVLCVAIAKIA